MAIDCSIIIPTYNTAELTLNCLRTIFDGKPRAATEVIVVDNHSSDGTLDRVRASSPQAKVIAQAANEGFAKACNRGARDASGRYFLFLNSDAELPAASIDALVSWMDRCTDVGVMGPMLVQPDASVAQMSWGWNPLLLGEFQNKFFSPANLRRSSFRRSLADGLQKKERNVPFVCGASFIVRREAFAAVRGFDENFELYFEDIDFCVRCRQAGWKIVFSPEVRVVHRLAKSSEDAGVKNKVPMVYRQSQILYYRKHACRFSLWLLKIFLRMKLFAARFSQSADRDRLRILDDIIGERRKIYLHE